MTRTVPRVSLVEHDAGTYPLLQQVAGAADAAAGAAGLPATLLELVRIRASQINGCAFCLDLHTRAARAAGESERRLHAVAAWEQSPLFDERERAALALTEAVTLLHDDHVPDAVYAAAAGQFDPGALTQLLWVIAVINTFNRLAVATRTEHPVEP